MIIIILLDSCKAKFVALCVLKLKTDFVFSFSTKYIHINYKHILINTQMSIQINMNEMLNFIFHSAFSRLGFENAYNFVSYLLIYKFIYNLSVYLFIYFHFFIQNLLLNSAPLYLSLSFHIKNS